ncbi:alpha/beta-hydrolase [Lindgomyces ingoldianus]|uniref:Alpha/beta-hydrolase n=1 Tax=Lindgomyces ingoldianus TaxID=673940 RepID=A0ACB6Q9S0_9PLEO|nr:alpha/beta-hydrolase [Lindgomyces ingoldianus]KAF2463659.1 alpha/beta-hydrolase [Lindgomyces ingoldianus]
MMPNLQMSIFAPPNPSNGCGSILPPSLSPGSPSVNFTLASPLGGGERRYLLHLPKNFSPTNSKPSPMILAFHGFGQPTASIEQVTQFSDPEINEDYIAVYPEGLNNVWLGDPGAPNSTVIDDRPFISDLLSTLESMLCVDTRRIYTTGLSNGGGLSGLLACSPDLSQRVAAFSGVSAAYYTTQSLGYPLFDEVGCKPGGISRRIPYLHVHGSKDMVIAYDGNNSQFDIDQNKIPDPNTLPISQWLKDWAGRNGCSSTGNLTIRQFLETGDAMNSTSVLENGTVVKSTWTCGGWADVVEGYYVEGLGHGWPSTVSLDPRLEAYRLGLTTWNASSVLLEWFARWSLPED